MVNKELKLRCTMPYGANIRKGPDVEHAIVGAVDHGDTVTVTADDYNNKGTLEYVKLVEPKAYTGTFVRKNCFEIIEEVANDVGNDGEHSFKR